MPASAKRLKDERKCAEHVGHHISSRVKLVMLLFLVAFGRTVTTARASFQTLSDLPCSCVEESTGINSSFPDVVPDCCCSYGTVNALNQEVLFPLLQDLVRTPFFRYFKAKLWCDCLFWHADGMCKLRDCSVCECAEDEFPEVFKARLPIDSLMCQEGKPQGMVDRTLDGSLRGWANRDNPWTYDDETDEEGVSYVNLLLNPERFTGYSGMSSHRIWDAIYNGNALVDQFNHAGAEGRVLYKLISGLHSSISIHIAAEYLMDEVMNIWGTNTVLLHDRVLIHPDRVANLYFCYLFVLRAVTKAGDYLLQADYRTGNHREDENTHVLVTQLVRNERLRAACPKPFDEAQLWRGADGKQLLLQLQGQFRNISSLMDCVGCEKCRLWGKLQILGLGTALEILFSENHPAHQPPLLQRNNVIALVNLLNRLSESLYFLQVLAREAIENLVHQHVTHGHASAR